MLVYFMKKIEYSYLYRYLNIFKQWQYENAFLTRQQRVRNAWDTSGVEVYNAPLKTKFYMSILSGSLIQNNILAVKNDD
jgi:hypothetical protein